MIAICQKDLLLFYINMIDDISEKTAKKINV